MVIYEATNKSVFKSMYQYDGAIYNMHITLSLSHIQVYRIIVESIVLGAKFLVSDCCAAEDGPENMISII